MEGLANIGNLGNALISGISIDDYADIADVEEAVPAMTEQDAIGYVMYCSAAASSIRKTKELAKSMRFNYLKCDFDRFNEINESIKPDTEKVQKSIEFISMDNNYEKLKSKAAGKEYPRWLCNDLKKAFAEIDGFKSYNNKFDSYFSAYKEEFNKTIWPQRKKGLKILALGLALMAVHIVTLPTHYNPLRIVEHAANKAIQYISCAADKKIGDIKFKYFNKPEYYKGLDGSEDEIIQDSDTADEKNINEKSVIAQNPDENGY
jgi:preprotein translocase subunit SecE